MKHRFILTLNDDDDDEMLYKLLKKNKQTNILITHTEEFEFTSVGTSLLNLKTIHFAQVNDIYPAVSPAINLIVLLLSW